MKPGAEAKYAEVYNRVGLPLAVILHWGGSPLRQNYEVNTKIARKLNAVILSTTIGPREDKPFYTYMSQRRGSTDRTSPYTPFVLLHRLGDDLDRRTWDDGRYSRGPLKHARPLLERLEIAAAAWSDSTESGILDRSLGRGVDTAAGRMGVIGEDYLSDLWAKWLITGRIAYSPINPPPENAEEANFRNMVAEYAPQIFRLWHDYLLLSIPVVIDI